MPTVILIDGIAFNLSSPYTEGQVLGPTEAEALNALRADRIKKNFTKRLREVTGSGKPSEEVVVALRAELTAYDSNYTLTVGERRKDKDPLSELAWSLAEGLVLAALAQRKVSRDSISEDKLNEKIAQVAARPDVLAEAKRRLDYAKGLAGGNGQGEVTV